VPITIEPALPVARMGEAAHDAAQRMWAERQRARQQQFAMQRDRMAQAQQQFQQQLQAQQMGRQQQIQAQNQRQMFGAQQAAQRQKQGFAQSQALQTQRDAGYRDNLEFLNGQRAQQQMDYLNARDGDKLAMAMERYQNPAQFLNPNGQAMAAKFNQMSDRIDTAPDMTPAEKEQGKAKLQRRILALNNPQYQKAPEKPQWEYISKPYDAQNNPTAFDPVHNPGGMTGPAGMVLQTPQGPKYAQSAHPLTGTVYTDPKTGIQMQIDHVGEKVPLHKDENKNKPDYAKDYGDAVRDLQKIDPDAKITPQKVREHLQKKRLIVQQMQDLDQQDAEIAERQKQLDAVQTQPQQGADPGSATWDNYTDQVRSEVEASEQQAPPQQAPQGGNPLLGEELDNALKDTFGSGEYVPPKLRDQPIYNPGEVEQSEEWKNAPSGTMFTVRGSNGKYYQRRKP